MNPFEKAILSDIPTDEAASFFLRVTGQDKVASVDELEAMWKELPLDEQEEILKQASDEGFLEKMMPGTEGYHSDRMRAALEGMAARCWRAKEANMGGGMPIPPAPKMPAPTPTALPATAQGMNSVKTAFLAAAEKLKIAGRKASERDLQDLEDHSHAAAGIGAAGGALGGAALGALDAGYAALPGKAGIGKRLRGAGRSGAMLAAAGAAGGYASSHFAKNHHRKVIADDVLSEKAKEKMKKAAAAMKIAFGNGEGNPAPPSDGTQDEEEPSLEEYLANEAMGAQAEEQAGASFFQQRLLAVQQELEQTKQQAEETAAKAQELEQQVSQSDEAVQSAMQQAQMASQTAMSNVQQSHEMAMNATNQAMESQAETLRQKQLAAAMRMGVQTLKDNVMGAMAQDPTDQLAQQLSAPPPGAAGMVGGQPPAPPAPVDPATGQPMAPDPAMAGGDPAAAGGDPAAAGGAPPAESPAEGGSEKKPEKKSEKKDDGDKDGKTSVEVKTGSIQARFLEAYRRTA